MRLVRLRGNEVLALTFANIFGSLAILILMSSSTKSNYRLLRELSQIDNPQPNLRGTKLKLIKIQSEVISKKKKNYDSSYFAGNEFDLPEKQISKEITTKALRHLSIKQETMLFALYADLFTFFFVLILFYSFCVEKNEVEVDINRTDVEVGCCICCVCCNGDNCNCDNCNCRGGECKCGEGGSGLILCALILLFFILLYFAVKGCGKKIARYIAITGEFLLYIVILFLVLLSGFNKDLNFIICIIAGILALVNLLTILLPNLFFNHRTNLPVQNGPLIHNQLDSNCPNLVTPSTSVANEPPPIPVSTDFSNAPIDNTTAPVYKPQAPLPYPYSPNNSAYPPQNPPYYPPPSTSNNGYNSGEGGIYNVTST